MRVAVAASIRPFADRPVREFVADLAEAIRRIGHEVEEISFPCVSRSTAPSTRQSLAIRLTEISHAGDLLITFGSPCHLLRHPHKVIWYHDPWGNSASTVTPAELKAFGHARRVVAASSADAASLVRRGRIATEVLYPSPLTVGDAHGRDSGEYVVVLDADSEALASAALDATRSRLRLERAWGTSTERRNALLADACAVLDLSDQGGLGLSTIAAFRSAKPVVTVTDAGIATELVHDGDNGRVVHRTVPEIARAIDELSSDRARATAMGVRGLQYVADLVPELEMLVAQLIG